MDNQQSKFPKDFSKQFKSKEQFHSFFNDLFKQGVEEMLKSVYNPAMLTTNPAMLTTLGLWSVL